MNSNNRLFAWATAFVAFESTLAYYSIYIYSKIGIIMFGTYFLICFYVWNKVKAEKNLLSKDSKYFFLSFLLIYIISIFNGYFPISLSLLWLLFGVVFISCKNTIKNDVVTIFVRLVCLLLTLSLFEYLIYITTGITFFHTTVIRGERFYEHILFNVFVDDPFLPIPRFQSLMDEPGLLGTLNCFLLYLISSDKKMLWEKTILWISGFFTFSLAFFIMAPFIVLANYKIKIKNIILVAIVLFATCYYMYDYIDVFITARLEGDNISNRTHDGFEFAYNRALQNGKLLWGMGSWSFLDTNSTGDAGAKVWIYQYGFIGLFIVCGFYISSYLKLLKKRGTVDFWHLCFLFVFWISFLQREYIDAPYNVILYFTIPYISHVKNT